MIHFVIEEKRNDYPGVRLTEYKSKIFLLIDQDCGSNCEVIVEKLTAHPKVTTVGANTIGALHYGNPITYVLPNSGILVYLPTRREVLENDAVEGIGYIPNIKTNYVDLNALFEKTKTKPH
jgi:C-terminal processing protease CtpA/Prc